MDGLKVKVELKDIEDAYLKIRKSIRNKKKLYLFEKNYYSNCNILVDKINSNNYTYSNYHIFTIKEKKIRLIISSTLEDKIVNHVICKKVLLPLDKYLIDSNCATRVGRGTSYARYLLDNYLVKIKNKSSTFYILKFDFSKYFYNINHKVLLKKLSKYLSKEDLLLIKGILNTTNYDYINNTIRNLGMNTFYKKDTGLPIGNYTSQFLAVFYLNDLDHFIKEELGCKYYIRYMDDGIILDSSKERLKDILSILESIVNRDYLLEFNNKTKIYKSTEGFTFLGINYKIKNNKIFRRIVSKARRRLLKKNVKYCFKYEK